MGILTTNKSRLVSFLTITLLVFPMPISAETPPIPKPKVNLEALQETIAKEKESSKKLEDTIKSKSINIEKLQKKLVTLTKDVQNTQSELGRFEKELIQLELKENQLSETLKADQIKMAKILSTLAKINKIPTQALMFGSKSPIDTARTVSVLETSFPIIRQEAKEFKQKLADLQSLKENIANSKKKVEKKNLNLLSQKTELEDLISLRQRHLQKDRIALTGHVRKMGQLAAQAESLQDLIRKLDEDRKKFEAERRNSSRLAGSAFKPKPSAPKRVLTTPSKNQNLPIPGIVKVNFGDVDNIGAKSQGLRIIGKPKMPVVSPLDGVVRFTGTFRNYGKMVIVEHHGEYHSLIGGLSRVDVQVGQSILSGEPIGILPAKKAQNPVLYFELRYNGKPINPAVKLKSLG